MNSMDRSQDNRLPKIVRHGDLVKTDSKTAKELVWKLEIIIRRMSSTLNQIDDKTLDKALDRHIYVLINNEQFNVSG